MAVSTYIVKIEDMHERIPISKNVETQRLQTYIGPVQDTFGIQILCHDFYDEVIAHVNGTSTNSSIDALLPSLKDFLVFKTFSEYLTTGNLIFSASGAMLHEDDQSTQPTDKQIAEAIAQSDKFANTYKDRLINFLRCNEDNYPTWKASDCACLDLYTKGNNQISMVGTDDLTVIPDWT